MIVFLRILFGVILVVMTWGTVRASLAQALFDIPPEVTGNPWFQVTLFDAYFAFLTFYVWVAWKERSLAARVLWLIVLMLWATLPWRRTCCASCSAFPRTAISAPSSPRAIPVP